MSNQQIGQHVHFVTKLHTESLIDPSKVCIKNLQNKGYTTLSANLLELNKLCAISLSINVSRLDDGCGI